MFSKDLCRNEKLKFGTFDLYTQMYHRTDIRSCRVSQLGQKEGDSEKGLKNTLSLIANNSTTNRGISVKLDWIES